MKKRGEKVEEDQPHPITGITKPGTNNKDCPTNTKHKTS